MALKAVLLTQGFILATHLSVFVGGRQLAPERSASSPSALSSSSSSCSRQLSTTLWGAAFAFFSVMADSWPASKTVLSVVGEVSFEARFMYLVLFAAAAPLFGVFEIFEQLFTALMFRHILHFRRENYIGPRSSTDSGQAADSIPISMKLWKVKYWILHMLFGFHETRRDRRSIIIANTDVVVGLSSSTVLPSTHCYSPVADFDSKSALIFGNSERGGSCMMQLNEEGKLALWSSLFLSEYNFQYPEGRFIISVQVIGYITSIVYRTIHHLPVSPIEAIGFVFSMLVIIRFFICSLGVIRQKPLVMYLEPAVQERLVNNCRITRWRNEDYVHRENAAILGVLVVGSMVAAFMVLVEWRVLRRSWLDAIGPILFLLSFVTQFFSIIILSKYLDPSIWGSFLHFGCTMISFGGIVVSIVATILNWQRNNFDSRTPSVIHNLPFLG